jgi:O-glycosyl hydrolase
MKKILIPIILVYTIVNGLSAQNFTIDGSKRYQTIHGLGVNINPQSWNVNEQAVKSVIDSLITGLGCTSFRLMFDDCDWETRNDNNDPNSYNWAYYDSIYNSPRFTCVWNTIRYLNNKGITDITLSPDGAAPAWMGGTKLKPGAELEYAETMASMIFYAQKRLKVAVHFTMLSPINETTCGGGEAPVMTTEQLGSIFSHIAQHFTKDGINNVTLIGPDDCGGWPQTVHAILSNPITMSKVKFLGGHHYGNGTAISKGLVDSVKNSSYKNRGVIMTEFNEVCNNFKCDGGTYNPDYGFIKYAGPAYKYALNHLNAGVNGIQIWEGYDSRYHHPNRHLTWSFWGIFGVNDTLQPSVYTVRPHYYVFKQLYKFVKPGYQRIDLQMTNSNITASVFQHPKSKGIVITGKNDSDKPQLLEGILNNLPKVSTFKYLYTDASHNDEKGAGIEVKNQRFSKEIPPFAVFTLISIP